MAQVVCPDREALAALGRGELSGEAAEAMAAHVEGCAACRAALADTLPDDLRQPGGDVRPLLALLRQADPLLGARLAAAPPGYELLGEVGRGGMGVVYRARDLRLAREVAVKLLREDYPAGSAACDRFLAEAQVTGQLQHPGVPAVHELGRLPDGRPFLAMKLVRGRTLHDLLRERPDPGHDRGRFVAAFEQVCQAVGCAHAHRVLHRDLKPGNVMVGAFGEVQVMDWGLAKVLPPEGSPEPTEGEWALAETLAAVTAVETPPGVASATRTGAVLGTPAYMPPEQAGGEVRKLDARSDVFGLGAILCQVLTGLPPYRGQDGNEVRLQALRGELQDAFARLRDCGAEPDLVALCERCLAFRQEDRPADGQSVAEEVARIRQAAEERARRAERERAEALVREAEQRKRRRQLLAAAAAVAAVLLAGIAGTTAGLVRAKGAAEAERQANERAQKRLKQVEKGNEVLTAIFADLDIRKLRPGNGPLRDALATRLVKAAGQLEAEAVGDPLVVAALQNGLGQALTNLGSESAAVPLLEKARTTRTRLLGPEHPDTLSNMSDLGLVYQRTGQLDKALPLLEETLRLRKAHLGADHSQTVDSMNNLATGYYAAKRFEEALPLLEEALRQFKSSRGADDPSTLICMSNLAESYKAAGKLAKALPLLEESLRLLKAQLGADHPQTLISMNNLALGYQAVAQLDKALPLFEDALRRFHAKSGADHPTTLTCMYNLARAYCDAKRGERAVSLFAEYFERRRKQMKPDDPRFTGPLIGAASKLLSCDRYKDAEIYLREGLAIGEKTQPGDWDTFNAYSLLGGALLGQKKYAEAEPLLFKCYEGMRQREKVIPPEAKARLTEALERLVKLYDAWGKPDEAAKWRQELARRKGNEAKSTK